jgi:TIR domain
MPRLKIFISHSSPSPAADRRLRAIATALRAEFTPWYDKRDMRYGKPWYRQVAKHMNGCDAALLLLDRNALNSDYVKHETSILSNRALTEDEFRFFIVLLDDQISRTSLGQGSLRAARIGEMQIWRPTAKELAQDNELAASLAEKINIEIGKGDGVKADARREDIAGEIKECLDDISDDAFGRALEATSRRTGRQFGELWGLIADNNPTRRRWLLANWFVNEAEAGLQPIIDFLKPLHGALQNARRQKRLLYLIEAADAYWLGNPDARCPISALTGDVNRGGIVAVNGKHVSGYTIKAFAHRALTPDTRFIIVVCDDGTLSRSDAVRAIVNKFEAENPARPMTEDTVRHLTKTGLPTICVLPKGFVAGTKDTVELDALRDTFGSIVFVVWPGEVLKEAAVPSTLYRIDPEVDVATEGRRYNDSLTLNSVLHARE